MPVTELDTTSWTSFESTLAVRLGELGEQEFVSVAEGSFVPEPRAKRGLFDRMFGSDHAVDSGAFVQAQRTGQLLYVECVGSLSFGGRHAWTPEQEAALERVGLGASARTGRRQGLRHRGGSRSRPQRARTRR